MVVPLQVAPCPRCATPCHHHSQPPAASPPRSNALFCLQAASCLGGLACPACSRSWGTLATAVVMLMMSLQVLPAARCCAWQLPACYQLPAVVHGSCPRATSCPLLCMAAARVLPAARCCAWQLPHAVVAAACAGGVCKSQESSLALLWTLGIFTLNCGPVVMGFVLDFLGPKLTGILGVQAPRAAASGCASAATACRCKRLALPVDCRHGMPGLWYDHSSAG